MKQKIKLFNSSTKVLDEIKDKNISIYLCGPTVYNHVHIGNIRPIIIFDVLHRFLLASNINVNFIHNITDIDDKIINKAIETKTSEKEITDKYFNHYKDVLNQLNIKETKMPRVSDNIEEMISYIAKLLEKGNAYELDGDIYFSLEESKDYGVVSNMEIENLNLGARIANKSEKKTPNDFVLWKKTIDGINWESPMGKGRPGWHTECCVLINKYIGEQVDIHGGGIDLRFPHHENENIQNVAMFNKPLSKNWCHIGHVMISNKKMSKSLNNFILAKDLLKNSNGNAIRWMFYQVKYEKPLNYFDEMLSESTKSVLKIEHELNRSYSYLLLNNKFVARKDIPEEVFELLSNDLDLPNLITFLQENIKNFSKLISQKNFTELNKIYNDIKNSLKLIGIEFENIHNDKNISVLQDWNKAIENKDFSKADELREYLIKIKLL